MIVTFSGMDCSGKSTQISELERTARKAGRRTRVVWHRGGYSPDAERLRGVARAVFPRAVPTTADRAARERAFSRSGVRKAWLAFAAIDTVWSLGVKVRAWSAAGELVLCDRYVWDTVIDFELRFGAPLPALHRALDAACPSPDARLLFVLPMPEILRRFDIKNEQFRESDVTRQARFDRYSELAKNPAFRVLDATRSVEDLARAVRESVGL